MKKKNLLAQRDALRSEAAAMLSAETFDAPRAAELEAQLAAIETEISAIEKLEARVIASAGTRTTATVHDNAEDKPWGGLGNFLLGVHQFANGQRDPRMVALAASGASSGINSEGAFLIEHEMSKELMQLTYDTGQLASRCRTIPLSGNGICINGVDETSRANGSRFGGIQAYRVAEAGTVTATKPAFYQVKLGLEKMMGLFYATDELLADATALDAFIRSAFPQEMAFKLDSEIMSGNGVGQCLGYFTDSNLYQAVTKKASQTAATIVVENVLAMWQRLPASCRANAIWLINQDAEGQLPAMVIGQQPVYLPNGSVAGNARYGTLLGRPVIPCEQAATLGTVGDIQLVDLSQYLLVTKGGLKTDTSMHVKFINDEMAFRFIVRNNGAPLWKTALTPFKGTAKQTPFVMVETRS